MDCKNTDIVCCLLYRNCQKLFHVAISCYLFEIICAIIKVLYMICGDYFTWNIYHIHAAVYIQE